MGLRDFSIHNDHVSSVSIDVVPESTTNEGFTKGMLGNIYLLWFNFWYVVGLRDFAIHNYQVSGVLNVVAPESTTNEGFTKGMLGIIYCITLTKLWFNLWYVEGLLDIAIHKDQVFGILIDEAPEPF